MCRCLLRSSPADTLYGPGASLALPALNVWAGSVAQGVSMSCGLQVFLTDQHLVLCMEYAPGGDLFKVVSHLRGLSEDNARWFFQQIILAIDYCHRMGVANRDIKVSQGRARAGRCVGFTRRTILGMNYGHRPGLVNQDIKVSLGLVVARWCLVFPLQLVLVRGHCQPLVGHRVSLPCLASVNTEAPIITLSPLLVPPCSWRTPRKTAACRLWL